MDRSLLQHMSCGLLVAFLVGCGGDDGPELYSVKGKVTKGGKPIAGVNVMFSPEGEGVTSSGLTNENGEFILVTHTGRAGAIAGKHKVILSPPAAAGSLTGSGDMSDPAYRDQMMKARQGGMEGGRRGAPAAVEKSKEIPEAYTNVQTTPLSFEVKKEDNTFEIPIT